MLICNMFLKFAILRIHQARGFQNVIVGSNSYKTNESEGG